jgi:hypothetical protein
LAKSIFHPIIAKRVLSLFGQSAKQRALALYKLEAETAGTALQNLTLIKQMKQAMGVGDLPIKFDPAMTGGRLLRAASTREPLSILLGARAPMSTAAHEFGHASGRRIRRLHQRVHIPLGIGIASAGLLFGDQELAGWSSLAPIGLAAPQLAEEARASIRGLSYLKKMGVDIALPKRSLGAAWATYASAPIALSAIAFGLSRLKRESNQFHGMQEQGMAAQLRKRMTDFGSGYQGLRALTEGQLREVDTPEEYFTLFDQALREYGVSVGTGHKRIAIPKKFLTQEQLTERLGFVPVKIAVPEAGQTTGRSFRHPKLLHHIHEHENFWTMHVDRHSAATMELYRYEKEAEKRGEPTSFLKKLALVGGGLKHVFTEGIPGAYYYIKGRLSGAPELMKRFATEVESGYWQLISRMERLSDSGGFWSNLPLFNKRADEHVKIEGMKEGGLAAALRKQNTEFGSKYDVMRAAARSLGTTFERLTMRKGWREALSQGRVVSELGAGKFGRAELMETEYQGMTFQYVRKTVEPERGAEWLGPMAKEHPEFLDPRHEALMMRPYGQSETIPSLYGVNLKENVIYMEHMPGRPVWELAESGTPIPDSVAAALHHDIKQMVRTNQVSEDIHGANVLYDPVTGRTSWIDMGGSIKIEAEERAAARWSMESGVERLYHRAGQHAPTSSVMDAARRAEAEVLGHATTLPTPKRISGMAEFGMAPTKRKLRTPFGSPWRGLFGSISSQIAQMRSKTHLLAHLGKDVQIGAPLLLDPRKAARMAEGKTLEQFAERLGHPTILVRTAEDEQMFQHLVKRYPATAGGAAWIRHPDLKKATGGYEGILIHPAKIRQTFYEQATGMGLDPAIAKRAVESEDFLKATLYHEVLEKQSLYRFKRLTRMEEAGASHNASQVLLGEGGFVQATGNEDLRKLFMAVRSQQPVEHSAFSAGLSAFGEKGAAPYLRMILSDFGSGYRGLMASTSRSIAKAKLSTARSPDAQSLAAIDLQIAQRKIWHCANGAGRYHTKRTNGFVDQLSRFGGGV